MVRRRLAELFRFDPNDDRSRISLPLESLMTELGRPAESFKTSACWDLNLRDVKIRIVKSVLSDGGLTSRDLRPGKHADLFLMNIIYHTHVMFAPVLQLSRPQSIDCLPARAQSELSSSSFPESSHSLSLSSDPHSDDRRGQVRNRHLESNHHTRTRSRRASLR